MLKQYQSIVIHTRVICQYSIGVNWNAGHCCACAGINSVLGRKVHNAGISKNILNVQYLALRLYMQGLNSSNSQIISL